MVDGQGVDEEDERRVVGRGGEGEAEAHEGGKRAAGAVPPLFVMALVDWGRGGVRERRMHTGRHV